MGVLRLRVGQQIHPRPVDQGKLRFWLAGLRARMAVAADRRSSWVMLHLLAAQGVQLRMTLTGASGHADTISKSEEGARRGRNVPSVQEMTWCPMMSSKGNEALQSDILLQCQGNKKGHLLHHGSQGVRRLGVMQRRPLGWVWRTTFVTATVLSRSVGDDEMGKMDLKHSHGLRRHHGCVGPLGPTMGSVRRQTH